MVGEKSTAGNIRLTTAREAVLQTVGSQGPNRATSAWISDPEEQRAWSYGGTGICRAFFLKWKKRKRRRAACAQAAGPKGCAVGACDRLFPKSSPVARSVTFISAVPGLIPHLPSSAKACPKARGRGAQATRLHSTIRSRTSLCGNGSCDAHAGQQCLLSSRERRACFAAKRSPRAGGGGETRRHTRKKEEERERERERSPGCLIMLSGIHRWLSHGRKGGDRPDGSQQIGHPHLVAQVQFFFLSTLPYNWTEHDADWLQPSRCQTFLSQLMLSKAWRPGALAA